VTAGDTFRFLNGEDPHLWMVISDPELDANEVLIVNVTSWRADKEQTCLLGPGDHPAIAHNSCIFYKGSRVHSHSHLNWLYNSGKIVLVEPLSASLLKRVREGAAGSVRMRLDHGRILITQGLVEG